MQIIATRTRAAGHHPDFAYRLYIPFDQLSPERQSLISYRTNFGHGRAGEHLARLREVIAPMAHLELQPGPARHEQGRAIDRVAERIEAIIVRRLYPEITAVILPVLLRVPANPDDAAIYTSVGDLTGRYQALAAHIEDLTPDTLGVDQFGKRAA